MKELNKNTQQAQRFINEYSEAYNNGLYTLDKVYKTKVSGEKERIFKKCKDYQKEYNGRSGVILSSNTYTFTYGFIIDNKNSIYPNLVIITKDNYYLIKNVRF